MHEEDVLLCAASAYAKKFYLNEEFKDLPQQVKDELKIMCVIFTENVGGTIQLKYSDDGELSVVTAANDDDFTYDEIGAGLKVRALQREKRELFESLELFYKVYFLGEGLDEED